MKHFLRTTAAALAAAFLLGGAGSLAAAAADNKEPETVKVESVCQDFVPLSDDIIRILPTEDCTLTAKIVQHSPERENLVLYDSTLKLKQGVYYVFAAEPGSYTAYFSMEAIENSKVLCKYETDFEIDNADYSTGDSVFSRTVYQFGIQPMAAGKNDKAAAELIGSNTVIKEGVKHRVVGVSFTIYKNVFRGDYDANDTTDLSDVQRALAHYTANMGGISPVNPTDAAHTAACDIDGDGVIGLGDVQNILKFYTMVMGKIRPVIWPDGLPDSRFPAETETA